MKRTGSRLLAASAAVLIATGLQIGGANPASAQAMRPGLAGPYLAATHAQQRGDVAAAALYFRQALAADRQSVDLLENAVIYGIAAGEFEKTHPLATDLLDRRPSHHVATLASAVRDLRAGNVADMRDLVGEGGNGPFVSVLLRAWADFELGDVDAARDRLRQLETTSGNTVVQLLAAYHLGLLETAAGNGDEATAAFLRGMELSGGASTIRIVDARARALALSRRSEDALALIREELDQTRGGPELEPLAATIEAGEVPAPLVSNAAEGAAEALLGIASILASQSGENDATALIYARLAHELRPDLVSATLLVAQLLEAQSQYELAIAAYDTVPQDAGRLLDALIGKASALQSLERGDEGIVVLKEAALRFGENIDVHTALGALLRRNSRFEEAAVAYDAAVALVDVPEQRHWPLYYQRGISYERSKQWEKAEADFLLALELEPEQPLVLNYLGYSWVEMGINLEEAKRMIEIAVEKRPQDGFITDSLGWVLYRLGGIRPGGAKSSGTCGRTASRSIR